MDTCSASIKYQSTRVKWNTSYTHCCNRCDAIQQRNFHSLMKYVLLKSKLVCDVTPCGPKVSQADQDMREILLLSGLLSGLYLT
jgi:hypothetical protein